MPPSIENLHRKQNRCFRKGPGIETVLQIKPRLFLFKVGGGATPSGEGTLLICLFPGCCCVYPAVYRVLLSGAPGRLRQGTRTGRKGKGSRSFRSRGTCRTEPQTDKPEKFAEPTETNIKRSRSSQSVNIFGDPGSRIPDPGSRDQEGPGLNCSRRQ